MPSNAYDHIDRPDARWLQTIQFEPGGIIRLHRYGGRHEMYGTQCHCHPLVLTVEEIHEPSAEALQQRIDNFYRRQ